MMSSKILDKLFIKVIFYSFHLNVNFYRNTTTFKFNLFINLYLHSNLYLLQML